MCRVTLIFLLLLCYESHARAIRAGQGQTVNTLAKAVSMARDGDTIFLTNGIYKEGNILLTRAITLIGEGNTILDGQKKTELLTISGRNITVKNIIFRDAGYSALNDFASIKVIDASNILIEGNTILNSYFAIQCLQFPESFA